MKKLCEDFLGKLAPELGHEVPRGERLRRLLSWVDLAKSRNAQHVVMHDADLIGRNHQIREKLILLLTFKFINWR